MSLSYKVTQVHRSPFLGCPWIPSQLIWHRHVSSSLFCVWEEVKVWGNQVRWVWWVMEALERTFKEYLDWSGLDVYSYINIFVLFPVSIYDSGCVLCAVEQWVCPLSYGADLSGRGSSSAVTVTLICRPSCWQGEWRIHLYLCIILCFSFSSHEILNIFQLNCSTVTKQILQPKHVKVGTLVVSD